MVDGEQADFGLLLDWMRAEELQVELRFGQGAGDVGRTGAGSGMLIAVLDSAATARVLVSVITTWLRRRRSGVIVRITVGDRTMELTSTTTAEASRRLEPLVAARTTQVPDNVVTAGRDLSGTLILGDHNLVVNPAIAFYVVDAPGSLMSWMRRGLTGWDG